MFFLMVLIYIFCSEFKVVENLVLCSWLPVECWSVVLNNVYFNLVSLCFV